MPDEKPRETLERRGQVVSEKGRGRWAGAATWEKRKEEKRERGKRVGESSSSD
jgi:hypothetical protein